MLLFEKYSPKNRNDFVFNRDILDELRFIASHDDIPHIIISGAPGGGKKTLARFFLEAIYDKDVHKLSKTHYTICGGSSSKKQVEIMQSDYHIVIEPTGTNHDKYVLQEIIKQYAMQRGLSAFKSQRKFKIILINNIEYLASNSQAALRRTMEIYAKPCRLIMLCNNLSKISNPLRSRCASICVPAPTLQEMTDVLMKISIYENMFVSRDKCRELVEIARYRLKTAIWLLDEIRFNCPVVMTLKEVFDNIVHSTLTIFNSEDVVAAFKNDVRSNIYNLLISNVRGAEIISTILDRLIREIRDAVIVAKLVSLATYCEYKLIQGRRDILSIDHFIAGTLKILYEAKYVYKCDCKICHPPPPTRAKTKTKSCSQSKVQTKSKRKTSSNPKSKSSSKSNSKSQALASTLRSKPKPKVRSKN